jgi:lipoate---protein ligase
MPNIRELEQSFILCMLCHMATPTHYRVFRSLAMDPYIQLASEEYLLDRAATDAPALFLWQSTPTVIIGKNQNPWRECDLDWMRGHHVQLARRISGGGAVYHDQGNLNYAFCLPRTQYDADTLFALVIQVLDDLGFAAERTNRTSLAVAGCKISGTAFCFRRNTVLHHGTLLVHAQLEHLHAALNPPPREIDTKATASVPARVRNLADGPSRCTIEDVVQAFSQRCGDGRPPCSLPATAFDAIQQRAAQLAQPSWCYAHTPPFRMRLPCTIDRVPAQSLVHVRAGRIIAADHPAFARPDAATAIQLEPQEAMLMIGNGLFAYGTLQCADIPRE